MGDVGAPEQVTLASGEALLLQELPEEAEARLAFFAGVLNCGFEEVMCRGNAGEHVAQMPVLEGTFLHSGNVLSVGLMARAVREIMGYFGREKPKVIRQRLTMILSRAAAQALAQNGKPANLRSDRKHDSVMVEAEDTPHEGFFLTRRLQLRHPTFDGGTSPLVTREVFVATDAAIVLPYDPKRDRVLLVEQFRMGPFGRGDVRPWMLEPVAGRLDAGETPEECARRECEEEAGLTLHGLEKIASHYCTPGCSTEYFHLFVGLCDLPDMEQGLGGVETENEDIRTHVISFQDAMGLLETGEADNGPLILSLLWLSQKREALRASA